MEDHLPNRDNRPTDLADPENWERRLRHDRSLLSGLTPDDRKVVEGVVEQVAADSPGAFVVVYGSKATGRKRADSDLDIYFEAGFLRGPFNRIDPNGRWHVFGMPVGTLATNLASGDDFAAGVVAGALVAFDSGMFRDLVYRASSGDG